jgi:hypothetical protein
VWCVAICGPASDTFICDSCKCALKFMVVDTAFVALRGHGGK